MKFNRGLWHPNDSRTILESWSALPTRSVSSASISIKIEAEHELTERSPLLAAQRQSGKRHFYTDYGIQDEHGSRRHREYKESKFLTLNNHERYSLSVIGNNRNIYTRSMYLYGTKPELCSIRLFGVLFILGFGLIIATYLMIAESRLPRLSFTLDLVNHDIWSKIRVPIESVRNSSGVFNVLILHTGGTSCDSFINCIDILKQMQGQAGHMEIPYNFVVADDGQTYEVRGWDHTSGQVTLPKSIQNTSLVIGFIGNYTNTTPNIVLLQSALSLIKESLRRKKLLGDYQIYGIQNITTDNKDAEKLFQKISKWPRFKGLLQVS